VDKGWVYNNQANLDPVPCPFPECATVFKSKVACEQELTADRHDTCGPDCFTLEYVAAYLDRVPAGKVVYTQWTQWNYSSVPAESTVFKQHENADGSFTLEYISSYQNRHRTGLAPNFVHCESERPNYGMLRVTEDRETATKFRLHRCSAAELDRLRSTTYEVVQDTNDLSAIPSADEWMEDLGRPDGRMQQYGDDLDLDLDLGTI